MDSHDTTTHPLAPGPPFRLGCVSYLNAAPLIDGLENCSDLVVERIIPSGLIHTLENNTTHLSLCPVIDFFSAKVPLKIVPVGGIGCEGPTLTVRLFSRCPIEKITTLHADTDSHTSVALVQVLLRECFDIAPKIVPYDAKAAHSNHATAEAMLLIGDKVVTDSPLAVSYPYQLDLGEAWHRLTDLPFVFATWMARQETELGHLPKRLTTQRIANKPRVGEIASRLAQQHGWPIELAEHYFRDVLRYTVGPRELQAITRFGELAQKHGLICCEGKLPAVVQKEMA